MKAPARNLTIILFASITAAVTFSALNAKEEHASTPHEQITDSFQNKIVLFDVDRSNALEHKSNSVALTEARILMIGNRYFVQGVGYSPEGVDHWNDHVLTGIAWENVTRFAAFTPDQFEKYVEKWKKRNEE